jgi:hypothetical protein
MNKQLCSWLGRAILVSVMVVIAKETNTLRLVEPLRKLLEATTEGK